MGYAWDDHSSNTYGGAAQSLKDKSRLDLDGVQYMDHLWDLVKDVSHPLQVTLRTDDTVFDDVPVRTWWRHGWFGAEKPLEGTEPEKSLLVFDIPDEVYRRIQSQHASKVIYRLFGKTSDVALPQALRYQHDDKRQLDIFAYHGPHFITEEITDDWDALRRATEMTARDSAQYVGGKNVVVGHRASHIGKARVVGRRLEIHIGNAIPEIIRDWQAAARGMIDTGTSL